MSDTERLTENERAIALMVAKREGGETRKWLNLVLKAYDAVEAERAGLAERLATEARLRVDDAARANSEKNRADRAEAARAGLETALREIAGMSDVTCDIAPQLARAALAGVAGPALSEPGFNARGSRGSDATPDSGSLSAGVAGPALTERSEFAWLIERGQPEGQAPPVWAVSCSVSGMLEWIEWTTDANKARRFPTRAAAEVIIKRHLMHPGRRGASARAVEHGFMSAGAAGPADKPAGEP